MRFVKCAIHFVTMTCLRNLHIAHLHSPLPVVEREVIEPTRKVYSLYDTENNTFWLVGRMANVLDLQISSSLVTDVIVLMSVLV
jgi:hypothetical protein